MDVAARGFAFDETSVMLVLIDGQAVNVVPYSGIQWTTIPITLNEIEKIEIIRGPASSVYGADALIGVINIISKNTDKRKTGISFLYGERSTQNYRLNLKHSFSPNSRIALTHGYTLTEKKGDAETPEAKLVAPNYDIKDWAKIYSLSYRFDYNAKNVNFMSSGGYSTDEEGYNPSPGDYSIDKASKKTLYLNNQLIKNFDDNTLTIRLGYRDLWQENEKCKNNAYVFKYTVEKGNGIDFDINYTIHQFKNHTIIIGSNLSHLESSRNIANTPPYIYDETDNLWSLFAQDEILFLDDKLSFTFGVRYDKWDTLNGIVTPKFASLIDFPNLNMTLRLATGTSFRRPDFDSNFYFVAWPGGWFKGAAVTAVTEDGRTIQGELLDPEKLTAYEIGIRFNSENNPFFNFLNIELFRNKVKNMIGFETYSSNNQSFHLGKAQIDDEIYIDGIEFALKKYYRNGLIYFINYTFQDATLHSTTKTDSTWENAPEHKISGGISYIGNFNFDLKARYVSKVVYQEIPNIDVDSYTSVDLAISKTFKEKYFLKLGIINLLNDEHYEYPIYTQITRKALLTFRYII